MAAMLCPVPGAFAQFKLDWYTIDGGGQTFSAGGVFSLGGTAGQPDAGAMAGGVYALAGGFWPSNDAFSGVEEPPVKQAPLTFRITAGGPNPFHHASRLQLELPEGMSVRVMVFDPAGCLVRAIQDGWMPAGSHTLVWKGDRDSGQRAPGGVYLMQLRAGRHESQYRVVLLQ